MKNAIIAAFVARLEEDLVAMKAAALANHEAATNEESKPENEYDTRGLEASYIAGAQAKRAAEIDEVLSLFKNLPFQNFKDDDPIRATALVEVKMGNQKKRLLVFPKGGGVQIQFKGQTVQIVTPASSMGQALLGLSAGDTAEFESGGRTGECEILSVQ
jgi:transcription elongation GreA/GreB family factor